jgi:predicted methyltransferase
MRFPSSSFRHAALALPLLIACSTTTPPSEAPPAPGAPPPITNALPPAEPQPSAAPVAHADAGAPPSFERRPRVAVPVTPELQAVVDATDRDPADRGLDGGRRPAELLSFFGVKRGQRVAELMAGGGYTAELLARAVGPKGKVYGVNSPFILQRFAEQPWSTRLKKPVMANVVRLDRDFDDPFPADIKNLDIVFANLVYHDFVWTKVDRNKLNAAVLRALKPGGVYAIVDHSARPADAANATETLHRIDEEFVKQEITAAGFRLDAASDFLRNPEDARDWNDSPRSVAPEKRGTSDRFALRFVKP